MPKSEKEDEMKTAQQEKVDLIARHLHCEMSLAPESVSSDNIKSALQDSFYNDYDRAEFASILYFNAVIDAMWKLDDA